MRARSTLLSVSTGVRHLGLALGVVGLMLPFAGVEAQSPAPRAIRLGTPMAGTLSAGDPSFEERGAFHVYRLEAAAGARYNITLRSDDFDAYLWVARSVSGITESIISDDDGGGDTDSRIRFRAPAAGTYLVVAQALAKETQGAYTLLVEEAPPPAPVVATALTLGQTVEGSISDASPLLEDENPAVPYQLYTYQGRGERVRISMRSGGFDAFLKVTRADGADEQELGTDDDSGGGTDASLAVVADGLLRIYARPLDASASGAFSISLVEAPMAKIISRTVTAGQTIAGTISRDDPEMEGGANFHQYAVTGRAGSRVRVIFRSDAFDAMLTASRPGPEFVAGESDDDGAGGTNAQLDLTLPESGMLLIRVHALSSGGVGDYTLVVDAR